MVGVFLSRENSFMKFLLNFKISKKHFLEEQILLKANLFKEKSKSF